MSKKKTTTTTEKQPGYIEELLTNGTTVLTARTRDELTEMLNDIPADCRYSAGAVGFNPTAAVYTLQVDITI